MTQFAKRSAQPLHIIQLTQGKVALVDKEDYEKLSVFHWYAAKDNADLWYACRRNRINGVRVNEYMHRNILCAPCGILVDHKNGNGLDNRRMNLRLATTAKNGQNSVTIRGSVPYKGVDFVKNEKKYRSRIRDGNRTIHLGFFSDPILAARAYDKAALKIFGEFAKTNSMLGLIE